jgi:rSAM/selenodomain-associated transferase 1
MRADVLVVFVKRPQPGEAKTRLVPALGAAVAAELYQVLAEEEVRRTAPRPGDYARVFHYAPAEARAEIEAWWPGEAYVSQASGDLGTRMASAFDHAFRCGARRVVLIGTDVPSLSREVVLEALHALDDHDLVLGPAHDGGYYLVGLERPRPELFRDIAWSTPAVLPSTVERAGVLGLSVRLLDPRRDIDGLDDVRAEWHCLAPLVAGRPSLRAALEASLEKTHART